MGALRRDRRTKLLHRHGRFYRVGESAMDASGHHPFKSKAIAEAWASVSTRVRRREHRVYRHD